MYTSATVRNAEIAHSTLIFTAVTQNQGDGRKSWHSTKITTITRDREYGIILQP